MSGEDKAPPQLPRRPRPSFLLAAGRGLAGRCPNCGKAALFRSYLKQVGSCPRCGEAWGHIRADDAPPWLTILVVGHVLVPPAIAVEASDLWPGWVSMTLWPVLALLLSLLILPRAKGLFIAAIWKTRAPGSEPT
ncbi:MAG TPA: DUF983 domain-containing protein [Rhodospirillales bacterium]|nr:DUF983 domain-containing protein [Rhodospirillales bacterium]